MLSDDHPPSRELLEQAYQAWDAEQWQRAGELLEVVARRGAGNPPSQRLWFDAALAYKFLRDWPKAYELGKHAVATAPRGEQSPAFWNLGIAATVLRDWSTARDCWRGFGIELPDTEGEIFADLGVTCVRIDTATGQEVVWARRLCPTRASVLSVPFDPGRRFGEVVLHDGAPNGNRVLNGTEVPVFDELMLFTPSELETLTVTVTAATTGDLEALLELVEQGDFGAEVLGSGQVYCKCCSEGSLAAARSVEAGQQTILVAAPEARATELLDQWRSARLEGRAWSGLHRAT